MPIEETEESDRGDSKGESDANERQRAVGGVAPTYRGVQGAASRFQYVERYVSGRDAARSVVIISCC